MAREQAAGATGPDGGPAEEALASRLAEVLGEELRGEPHQLSSGASRETFRFAGARRGEMVVQIERRAGGLGPRPPAQAALLHAACEAGVPVAGVVAHGGEDPVLGRSWLILEALEGTADPEQILAGEGVPDAAELLDSLGAALAAVHRMPADPQLARPVEDPLALLRDAYEGLGEPHPTFELAFRALASEPPPTRRAFVHGDFRMGNLLIGPRGVTGVLDWELAHLGDPVEDLGWLCVPAWRFSRPDRPAAGLGTREELLAAYERHAGVQVDPEALRWWELAGTLRWGVICVMQAHTHLSGAKRSIEHAVIGRRACEVEWDLLELLEQRAPPGHHGPTTAAPAAPAGHAAPARPADAAPAQDAHARSLHDRPTALELIEAAREALGDELLPRLEGRAAFQLRVVLRALGIVRRELAHDLEHRALRESLLAHAGAADEGALGEAIRRGEFEEREGELRALLRALVRAKLEVARPSYLSVENAPAKEKP